MFDGANRTAQFGQSPQPADRGIARIGPLGLGEIVEHAVAVIRPEYDLVARGSLAVFGQQRLEYRDHVDVAVEMIGLSRSILGIATSSSPVASAHSPTAASDSPNAA